MLVDLLDLVVYGGGFLVEMVINGFLWVGEGATLGWARRKRDERKARRKMGK